MTTFLLIRHAQTDFIGSALAGWIEGVRLNEVGRAQAERLAEHLAGVKVAALYSSPLERALETAAPMAARFGLDVQPLEEVGELRYGSWEGRSFDDLASDPAWHRFNAMRSLARIADGEMMIEAQARVIAALERLRLSHREATVAVVSHADIIKAALMHYLGVPMDFVHRLEISPASVSVIEVDALAVRVVAVNQTDEAITRNA
ncbi:MAG: histidine phosphatase family protein [Blastocatellia bacterium]